MEADTSDLFKELRSNSKSASPQDDAKDKTDINSKVKAQDIYAQYRRALILIIIAVVISWWSVNWGPKNPNHFAGQSVTFSWPWFYQTQENNAPLRLNIIDTEDTPYGILEETSQLTIEFLGTEPVEEKQQQQQQQTATPLLYRIAVTDSGQLQQVSVKMVANSLSIEFEPGRFSLLQHERIALRALALEMASDKSLSISLRGESNPDDQLRQYRLASEVENYLINFGANEEQINVEGNFKDAKSSFNQSPISTILSNRVVIDLSKSIQITDIYSQFVSSTSQANITINGKVVNKNFITLDNENWRVSTDGLVQTKRSGEWITVSATKAFVDDYYQAEGVTNWRTLKYSATPSPLSIILSVLIGLVGIFLFLLPPRSKVKADSFLEDFFVNDAPITSSDPNVDKLNFAPIADSLSEFLRNDRTAPPLSVAITGEWGSGKSSLMKLLQNELQAHRINPVWVNAWHHQNETQFLSGLLEKIREDALPKVFSSANIIFQLNLFWLRIKRQPLKNFLLFAPIFIAIGLLTANNGSLPPSLITSLGLDKQKGIASSSEIIVTLYTVFVLFSSVGNKISSLTGNSWFKKVIGLRPKSLDLRSMVGLREQFVSEFQDICKALEPTTLTIFIDDLDRCNEKRILDILESVNFLVSSGNCFIVIGMEKEPVEKAIANYYKRTHQGNNDEALLDKAKRYLEKLINIEVPIPETNSEQSQSLTKPEVEEPTKRNWGSWAKNFLQLLSFCVFFIWTGVVINENLSNTVHEEGEVTSAVTVEQESIKQLKDELSYDYERPPLANPEIEIKQLRSVTTQAYNSHTVWWAFSLVIFFIVFIALEKLRQRKSVVESDSEVFVTSIEQWSKAVGATRPTPRKIKRFINRTRFLAIRSKNSDNNEGKEINEDEIVTFAALYEIMPDLFEQNEFYTPTDIIENLETYCTPEHVKSIRNEVKTHCSKGNKHKIELFKRWTKGFALRG